jgi:L-threonylcarbamoyladenylate synthase
MKRLLWDDVGTVDYVEKQLRAGRVVLGEGDTVLGLLAAVSHEGTAHLDVIKHRSKKPYLMLVSDIKKALHFIEKSDHKTFQIEKIMNNCWPGPVTLIFKAKADAPACSTSPEGNIALRVPDHAGLQQLLQRFDGLFSTSANSSGMPVPDCLEAVDKSIVDAVACIVCNSADTNAVSTLPSTIIDCTGDRLVVVRAGAFNASELLRQ